MNMNKIKENEKDEASKLAEFIEKLYFSIKGKTPKIKIRNSYSIFSLRYLLFGPPPVASYNWLLKEFTIYKDILCDVLKNEDDKDAAIFGIAVHEVAHVNERKTFFSPRDFEIAEGIAYYAIEEANSKFSYDKSTKLRYFDKEEYDAEVREYIARALYKKLRNYLEEDEILINAKKVINANHKELLKNDFKVLLRLPSS